MYCTGQEAFVHCNSVMGETYALRFVCRFELMNFFSFLILKNDT